MKRTGLNLDFEAIRERIEKEKSGLRTSEWARKVGVAPNTVSNIHGRTRQNPSLEYIIAVALATGKPVEYFLTGETKEGIGPISDEFAYVPRVDIALSAGGGMEVLSEEVTERLSFNKVWLKKVATATRNLVLMDVSGESMEPILSDGDMVLVDQGRTRIAAGKIYAVNLGDNLVAVKRLESRGKTVMVISENKAHEAFSVAGKDLKIIGQVIWYCRQLVPFKENNNG